MKPLVDSEHHTKVTRSPVRCNDYITLFILSDNHVSVYIALVEEDELTLYEEACASIDVKKWQCTMEDKTKSLRKNKT